MKEKGEESEAEWRRPSYHNARLTPMKGDRDWARRALDCMQHSSKSFSQAAEESPRRSCSLDESSVSHEWVTTNTLTELSDWKQPGRSGASAQTQYIVDALGWQSRTVGARTDSKGKKWSWEMNYKEGAGCWSSSSSTETHHTTPDCVNRSIVTGICTLIKTIFWQMWGGGS